MTTAWEDMSVEEKLERLREDFLKLSASVAETVRRADAAHCGFDPLLRRLDVLEALVSKTGTGEAGA